VLDNDSTADNARAYACSQNGCRARPCSINITNSHPGVGTFAHVNDFTHVQINSISFIRKRNLISRTMGATKIHKKYTRETRGKAVAKLSLNQVLKRHVLKSTLILS
jgi:hypothetical protein